MGFNILYIFRKFIVQTNWTVSAKTNTFLFFIDYFEVIFKFLIGDWAWGVLVHDYIFASYKSIIPIKKLKCIAYIGTYFF